MTSWVKVGAARLQEAQDATGLSNERLAREIPVSAKTWERWKKRGEIPASAIPAVAKALGIEVRRAGASLVELPSGRDAEEPDQASVLSRLEELAGVVAALAQGQQLIADALGVTLDELEQPAAKPAQRRAGPKH